MSKLIEFLKVRLGFIPAGHDKLALSIWLFDRRRRRDLSLRGVKGGNNQPMCNIWGTPEAILVDIVDAYIQLQACSVPEPETILRIDQFRSKHLGNHDALSIMDLPTYVRSRVEREQKKYPISTNMFPWFINDSVPRSVAFLKSHSSAKVIDDKGIASSINSLPTKSLKRHVQSVVEEMESSDPASTRALDRLLSFFLPGDEIWEFTADPGCTGYVRDGYALIRAGQLVKAVVFNQVHYYYG